MPDSVPGITRRRKGSRFLYFSHAGKQIRDPSVVSRIRHLAIPPAWKEVWISPRENSHLQATGRDFKNRKQYRYHERWREVREETKYHHLLAFGHCLPEIRARVTHDLSRKGFPRRKILATVVRLLEMTLIRVGNEEYARENHSYGLTTPQNRHVEVKGGTLTFHFRGKSGKNHLIDVKNKKLAKIVRKCRDLPGHELFQYLGKNGKPARVTSLDVNAYLREITKQDFTAKDFRTWAGTVLAAKALQEFKMFTSKAEAKRNILTSVEAVAKILGNTPAVCRRCYVHPAILDTYMDGTLMTRLKRKAEATLAADLSYLRPEEVAVLLLLRQTLQ